MGIGVAVVTIIVSVQSIIITGNSALESKLNAKLETNNTTLIAKLETNNTTLNAKLDDNTASIKVLNTKLDALTANVLEHRIETANLQGQVGVPRDVVTTTPTPTKRS